MNKQTNNRKSDVTILRPTARIMWKTRTVWNSLNLLKERTCSESDRTPFISAWLPRFQMGEIDNTVLNYYKICSVQFLSISPTFYCPTEIFLPVYPLTNLPSCGHLLPPPSTYTTYTHSSHEHEFKTVCWCQQRSKQCIACHFFKFTNVAVPFCPYY